MKVQIRVLLITCLLLVTGMGLSANSVDSLRESARVEYSEGQYRQALDHWKTLVEQGYESADIYYNMGNACFKSDQIPQAIYYWEKALKLNPGHHDAGYNLKLANTMIDDKIEPLPEFFLKRWYETLIFSISTAMWRWFSLAFTLLATLLLILVIFRGRRSIMTLALIMFALSGIFIAVALHQSYLLNNTKAAIVFTPTVTIKSSPDDAGKQLFVIHQGTKVKISDELHDWYRIQIADGNQGWLKKEDVARL